MELIGQKENRENFIPASGYRMYFNSQLLDVSSYSRCWSGAPCDAINGYSLTFTSSNVNPQYLSTVRAGSLCAPSKNKQAMGIFFIPASGYRTFSSSQLDNVSSQGYYWSTAPGNATNGYYLTFYPSTVRPQYNYAGYLPYGFSVRPVQE